MIIQTPLHLKRYILPFATAIMLTFGRSGFLPFAGIYLLIDFAIDIFVVGCAIYVVVKNIEFRHKKKLLYKYFPFFIFIFWVVVRGLINGIDRYLPTTTTLISCVTGISLGLHFNRQDLPLIRRCLLFINLIFVLMILIYTPSAIYGIGTSDIGYSKRLGEEISASNLVAFPRVVYTLVIAGIGCMIIEKNTVIRVSAMILSTISLLIGFSAAGRGTLLGLVAGVFVLIIGIPFVFGFRKKLQVVSLISIFSMVIYFVVEVLTKYFPLFLFRINNDADSGRFNIWEDSVKTISIIGSGITEDYAHNLFLETLHDYGVIGIVLIFVFLYSLIVQIIKAFKIGKDMELIVLLSIIVLQFVAQQLSLNMYYGFFWTAMVLPLGLNNNLYRSESLY